MLFFLLVYQLHKNADLYEFFLIYVVFMESVFLCPGLSNLLPLNLPLSYLPFLVGTSAMETILVLQNVYKFCRSQLAY